MSLVYAADSSHPVFELRRYLASVLILLLGFGVLTVGSPSLDPRASLSGVSLSLLVFLVGLVFVISIPELRRLAVLSLVLLTPLGLLSLTLFWSVNTSYGIYKLFNLLACTLLAVPLIVESFRRLGMVPAARVWVVAMLGLLLITVIYKLRYGFFDRQVLFFMNGPIVFARMMGTAAVLSLFAYKGLWRLGLTGLFSLAVLWAMSKGPLLALILSVSLAVTVFMRGRDRWTFILSVVIVVASGVALFWDLLAALNWGRLQALGRIFAGDFFSRPEDFESTSIRVLLYRESWDLISRFPLGVGLGDWEVSVAENFGLHYPHNLLFELWSEGGLVLGSIAVLPFLYFLLPGPAPARTVALFLFLAQMVSGDLLNARHLLLWAMMVPLLALAPTTAPQLLLSDESRGANSASAHA